MSGRRPDRPWPKTAKHGTENGYGNLGCRCAPCTDAHRLHGQKVRARRIPPPPDDPRHGLSSTYLNYGCRCDLCRAANTQMRRGWRARSRAALTDEATA